MGRVGSSFGTGDSAQGREPHGWLAVTPAQPHEEIGAGIEVVPIRSMETETRAKQPQA
jgi:hypothetical protein